MAKKTQQFPNALPGRRYGSFAGRLSVSLVNGPLIFAAAQIYRPGMQAGEIYRPGHQQAEIYRPGMMAGEKSG